MLRTGIQTRNQSASNLHGLNNLAGCQCSGQARESPVNQEPPAEEAREREGGARGVEQRGERSGGTWEAQPRPRGRRSPAARSGGDQRRSGLPGCGFRVPAGLRYPAGPSLPFLPPPQGRGSQQVSRELLTRRRWQLSLH